MARRNSTYRTGTGAMNLDTRGRRNAFNRGHAGADFWNDPATRREAYNRRRRRSNGGMGG